MGRLLSEDLSWKFVPTHRARFHGRERFGPLAGGTPLDTVEQKNVPNSTWRTPVLFAELFDGRTNLILRCQSKLLLKGHFFRVYHQQSERIEGTSSLRK
jgi:hypothetical protein